MAEPATLAWQPAGAPGAALDISMGPVSGSKPTPTAMAGTAPGEASTEMAVRLATASCRALAAPGDLGAKTRSPTLGAGKAGVHPRTRARAAAEPAAEVIQATSLARVIKRLAMGATDLYSEEAAAV